jgi:hypothetical protein
VTVIVEDGFAVKLCEVPSQGRVVGLTPAPESVIVPAGPELATVQVMGCVTVEVTTVKSEVIVPGPETVAVVLADVELANVIEPVLELQEEKA